MSREDSPCKHIGVEIVGSAVGFLGFMMAAAAGTAILSDVVDAVPYTRPLFLIGGYVMFKAAPVIKKKCHASISGLYANVQGNDLESGLAGRKQPSPEGIAYQTLNNGGQA